MTQQAFVECQLQWQLKLDPGDTQEERRLVLALEKLILGLGEERKLLPLVGSRRSLGLRTMPST